MLDLRRVFDWLTKASFIGSGAERVSAICTDSRAIERDSLFVALRGERFDAHDFVVTAREAGAAAVLVEHWVAGMAPPAIRVPDTRRALGEIARGWRQQFNLPLVAITGSNGKTTVKEMVAAIFTEHRGRQAVLATRGNLNNEVGVPMTLLALRDTHALAVVELGMNHAGEIAWLADIARPSIALVNNAQREHQEFLASVEATARENGSAISALSGTGTAVFPGDDSAHTPIWRELRGDRRALEFGLSRDGLGIDNQPLAVWAEPEVLPHAFTMHTAAGRHEVKLAIDGVHNVRNALAASACALAAGVCAKSIIGGLARFRPAPGRLVRHRLNTGALLIDDTYNANPDSVLAAIALLATFTGPRILVLGDMGEVGDQGAAWHREIGVAAARRGVDHLLLTGVATREAAEGFGQVAEHFGDDVDGLAARARQLAVSSAVVLVKGSRFMRMERVVGALTGDAAVGGH